MNIILIKAIQLLLCLSLLVVLHEGGHFGFAKLFKTRVTRFYLFANWGFHLFSTYDNWFRRLLGKPLVTQRGKEGQNLFVWVRNTYYRLTGQKDKVKTEGIGNKKYDDSVGTEYGIGWLPIGGYVAIAGMIDETNHKLEGEAQPWEFRSKKVWQRFLIMVGGVLMNLITAFVIYCGIMFFVGEDRLPDEIVEGVALSLEQACIKALLGQMLIDLRTTFREQFVALGNTLRFPNPVNQILFIRPLVFGQPLHGRIAYPLQRLLLRQLMLTLLLRSMQVLLLTTVSRLM